MTDIGMPWVTFLDRVITDGMQAAKKSYKKPRQKPKLEGSLAGFKACRWASPYRLGELLIEAHEKTGQAVRADIDPENYWYLRCFELEVEWVCNVASAALFNQGLPVIVPPTARGVRMAAKILGVEASDAG